MSRLRPSFSWIKAELRERLSWVSVEVHTSHLHIS